MFKHGYTCRDLTIYGTQMAMTSCHLLDLPYMDVLMGKNVSKLMFVQSYIALIRFSRRVLWLKVGFTNHNPGVIVHHYLECVKQCGGEQYHG